ncbi:MAG: hypothetical protein M0P19_11445, partial [Nevskia sp.]|nr:hypothetical protein [Nevskia sp.]
RSSFYEKLYFYELERREKISARLAIPFGVIVATIGLLSFMLNAAEKPGAEPFRSLFWLLLASAAVALAVGAWFFRKAWFGHTDKLLPTAGHLEAYYRELQETYKSYENADQLVKEAFNDALFNYFTEYSSENAISNDARSYNIYRATASLTVAVFLAFLAAVPFFFGASQVPGAKHGVTQSPSATTSPTTRP